MFIDHYVTVVFTVSHITRYQPCLLITIVTIVFTISHITRYQPCLLITIVTIVFTVSHITRYQPCLLITIVTIVFTISHITRYQPCLLITIVTIVFTISHITRYQPCLLITIIPNELFDDALLKPDRQEFAALFLEKKSIMVHKYLHHKKLLYLFNNVQNPEFFMTLCIEGVLERALDNAYPLTKQFLIGDDSDLNLLLYKLTNLKALVSTYDLSMNAAINTLVLWAALTNNVKLTKTLWKYTDDPMPVALLVSMIWHNLAKICYRDVDTKTNLREAALDFGKLAVKLLDITYRDSPALAIASLEKTLPDFNNHAVIEVAKISRNKMFIAHSICQKWLARKWYGNLNIREVDFKAFRLPDWFKIYMSIFLIFPMFIWITFERKKNTRQARNNGDSDEELMDDEALLMKPMSNDDRWILSTVTHGVTTVTHGVKSRIDKIISYGRQNLKVPIYLQFYYFWSAPITKFWVSQLFYILYLIFFSLSVIIPSCGNIHMDFIVFIWTALIWMEIVRTTFVMKKVKLKKH
ncbi:hypothetical protein KUTeg_017316 [Tegillarca granosa]|uniref:TRPM-like domain-containing protein n=1 Tax=Tegillarca granosa TaxID=220873 RepID=A0ABQ9EL77_TEGGR|nr:hypothetical protein KUTeg_017316 [Tegillarca granosa]